MTKIRLNDNKTLGVSHDSKKLAFSNNNNSIKSSSVSTECAGTKHTPTNGLSLRFTLCNYS